jgi:hypothetical protein
MNNQTPIHRLFGLTWIDFFKGTSVQVETEVDLSLKQQFLDVVIIHKPDEVIPWPLPDGFEDTAVYNLVTWLGKELAFHDDVFLLTGTGFRPTISPSNSTTSSSASMASEPGSTA